MTEFQETPHGKKLCDSVFSLHEPDESPHVEIVFIHGLQREDRKDAYRSTWFAEDGTEDNCWPATWLKASFPKARILSLSYDASRWTTHTTGRMDMYSLGESLLSQMLLPDVGIGQRNCPVCFVCHSLGGLVAKQIVIMAHQKATGSNVLAQNLLRNIKGFYFYGTPHAGSRLAELVSELPFLRASPLLDYLKVLNKDMGRLNSEFEQIQREVCRNEWKFSVAAETNATKLGFFHRVVVEEASARLVGYPVLHVAADHFTICKPKSLTDTSFLDLKRFLNDIVTWYYKRLRANLPSVPPVVVGMAAKEKLLDSKLQVVSVVGLVGMGGIGKTTLSRTWYNSRFRDFEKSSYLEDVKSKPLGVVQKQLLKDVCNISLGAHEVLENYHVEQIKDRITTTRVLVVVDDIPTDSASLEALGIPAMQCGESGSKVILTCRNWQDLQSHVPADGRIDIEELEYEQAMELFRFHAFKGDKVSARSFLEVESGEIVKACGGLPLSIEVMGGYVGSKINLSRKSWTKEVWRDALRRLGEAEAVGGGGDNDKLWKRLRICYDDLERREQSIFLDIACYFCNGFDEDFRYVTFAWGSVIEFENLKDRSLIKVDLNGDIRMHDQLRDLGRKIVKDRTEGKLECRSHLWTIEETKQMIQGDKPFSNLEVLSVVDCRTSLAPEQSNDKEGNRGSASGWFPQLRLLNLKFSVLAVVEYCLAQSPRKLTWLCLSGTEVKTLPGTISFLKYLCFLDLRHCDYLEELPESIGELGELQALYLTGCGQLKRLPESMGGLKSLQSLDLSNCYSLVYLPKGVGQLPHLTVLDVTWCPLGSAAWNALEGGHSQLEVLRGVWGVSDNDAALLGNKFPALKVVHLYVGVDQETLPAFLWECSGLTDLLVEGDSHVEVTRVESLLKEIPVGLGNLLNLETLTLSHLGGLERLPENLGCLSQLRDLTVEFCPVLVELPESTGRLSQLSYLDLTGCWKLESTEMRQISIFRELQKHGCSQIFFLDGREFFGKDSPEYCAIGDATCDGCDLECIPGKWWHCDVCIDFDLCQDCYEQSGVIQFHLSGHVADHPMTGIPVVVPPLDPMD